MTQELSDKLKIAMAQLDKEFGKNTVVQMGNVEIPEIDFISTGAPSLDYALGIGGVPRGRVTEIYGGESAGKSTLALSLVAQAQKKGLTCAYVDSEHAMDLHYATKVGVDVDNLLFSQPTTGEEAMSIVERLVATGDIGLIVIDSVAALTPKAELEGDIGQNHVGLLPRLMAQSLRMINASASKTNTAVVFINQIREKIGVMFGNPETQPGGRALKFYSSVRLDLRRKDSITDANGEIAGITTNVKVIKNKVGPPLRKVEMDIIYGEGVDYYGGIGKLANTLNIIKKKSGGWMEFEGENICQGDKQLSAKLAEDSVLLDKIYNLIYNKESDA